MGGLSPAGTNTSSATVLIDDKYLAAVTNEYQFKATARYNESAQPDKLLVVDSDPAAPLVFLVTGNGYEYVSGRGSIKTPTGTRYEYS